MTSGDLSRVSLMNSLRDVGEKFTLKMAESALDNWVHPPCETLVHQQTSVVDGETEDPLYLKKSGFLCKWKMSCQTNMFLFGG